ncbi:MAG: 3-methyl-2-oxobutanoate hydroxymethyltransferase [Candidatus Sumerlaeota bacterium]|nr:3-methyl-2-oxobutanoate hydroxymethyltransferase [Candidatus Sumerlaeota bacterium]
MAPKRVTADSLREMKANGQKIAMLTAYDCLMAQMIDEAGADIILVGDSVAMVFAGYENTLPMTMQAMIYHTEIVARCAKRALVVGDMPFMSYQVEPSQALANAGRFIQEARAHAVKLEGGRAMATTIRRIVRSGIPVMGHIGLTPQSVYKFGGYTMQGSTPEEAQALIESAKVLQDNGIFALVVEKVPSDVAARIAETVEVPVIGIGAGPGCDGQVLVAHDMLGMFERFKPKFVKRYAQVGAEMRKAFDQYVKEVKSGEFPDAEHSY